MREILFRGKRMDNGKWIEGFYGVKIGDKHYIIIDKLAPAPCCDSYFVDCAVIPETVGQYTGLKDRNGQRIFEGDVIHTHYANVPPEKCNQIEQVVFHNGRFCGMYSKPKMKMWANLADGVPHFPQDKSVYMDWCEVIGNIHDNPEMMKGDADA